MPRLNMKPPKHYRDISEPINLRRRAKVQKYRERLKRNAKFFKELWEITDNTGNDLIRVTTVSGKLAYQRRLLDSPPMFDQIMDKNATIVPMPIILAFMPTVYYRIFVRFIILTMDTTALSFNKTHNSIYLHDFYTTLSKVDQLRFDEVILFLLKSQILCMTKGISMNDEWTIELNSPYRYYYCGLTVSAMSAVAKTHITNKREFMSNDKYRWKEWKKLKPHVLDFDRLIKESELKELE